MAVAKIARKPAAPRRISVGSEAAKGMLRDTGVWKLQVQRRKRNTGPNRFTVVSLLSVGADGTETQLVRGSFAPEENWNLYSFVAMARTLVSMRKAMLKFCSVSSDQFFGGLLRLTHESRLRARDADQVGRGSDTKNTHRRSQQPKPRK